MKNVVVVGSQWGDEGKGNGPINHLNSINIKKIFK